jgi:hypothetical protein
MTECRPIARTRAGGPKPVAVEFLVPAVGRGAA